jgi:hypothetical protein
MFLRYAGRQSGWHSSFLFFELMLLFSMILLYLNLIFLLYHTFTFTLVKCSSTLFSFFELMLLFSMILHILFGKPCITLLKRHNA